MVGIKNLIWISSFLIGIYNERNEIVLNLLKKRKNNEDCILNEIITWMKEVMSYIKNNKKNIYKIKFSHLLHKA